MATNPHPPEVYLHRTHKRKGDVRGNYFRDQTAIIHSRPFRRLKHKTQVFFSPMNDHICTRMEHVLHVATIAVSLCKGLNAHGWNLDMELAYAIGLGHDLGHAPFGHVGERAINEMLKGPRRFHHELHSHRVAEHLAYSGKGLNLTYAVKDGIVSHCGERFERAIRPDPRKKDLEKINDLSALPGSYEGCIVRAADKVAYLGRDIEDAVVAKLIRKKDIPADVAKGLGTSNAEIIQVLIDDLIENSRDSDEIRFSQRAFELLVKLRNFNYNRIYLSPELVDTRSNPSRRIIHILFEHLMESYEKNRRDYPKYRASKVLLDANFGNRLEDLDDYYARTKADALTVVTDFVAGMTDPYALESFKQVTFPTPLP